MLHGTCFNQCVKSPKKRRAMTTPNTPEHRRSRICTWILGSSLTICWGQSTYAEESLPSKPVFELIKGHGVEVCEAYLQRLNATEFLGRVEMWRDGLRLGLTVAASFVWQCLISLTIAPFPHLARQTGRADFPHPAFFRTSSLRVQQVGARTWQAVEPQSFIQVLVRVLAIPRSALTTSAH